MTTTNEAALKKRGIVMLSLFFLVLGILFCPVFPGKVNGLDYIDNLFNMISKGSSDFIVERREEGKNFAASTLSLRFTVQNETMAVQFAHQLEKSGVSAAAEGRDIKVNGSMTALINSLLDDCRSMFDNDGSTLQQRYGFDGRTALYNWWSGCKAIISVLNQEKRFKEAKFFGTLCKKAIEPAYNYYGIEPREWKANIVMIVLSLAFYVCYTLWYGFGILYLFEGWGLKVGH